MLPEGWSPARRCFVVAPDEGLADIGACMPFLVQQTFTIQPGHPTIMSETTRCIKCDYVHTVERRMELRDMQL